MAEFGGIASVQSSGWILSDLPEFATCSRAQRLTSQPQYRAVAEHRKGENMNHSSLCASFGILVLLAPPAGLLAQPEGPKTARYTVTDIGTLGGTYSFPYAINNPGMVAGGAATPSQTDGIS